MGARLKSALTRKFGPLPAWAWAALLGGAYYFYRKYSAAASGTGTGSVAPVAPTPQPGQLLQPGESYYDPNTGALTTAPGGGSGSDSSGGGGTDGSTPSAADIAGAVLAGLPPPEQGDPGTPGNDGTPGTPGTNARVVKPKAPAQGGGSNSNAPKGAPGNIKGNSTRARSVGTIIKQGRGKAKKAVGIVGTGNFRFASNVGRPKAPKPPKPKNVRQRPKTPVVKHTVNQRAEATHPKQSPTRQTGHPAPKPAPKPAPRKVAPKPPPKKAPRPRPKPAPKRK